jgi:phage-related protein
MWGEGWMYKVISYKDKRGRSEIDEFIDDLERKSKTSKEARIRFKKILDHLAYLEKFGTRIGYPVVRHIEDDIWELRPNSDRIFFFYWEDNIFVLLHHFMKKTQRTPSGEIEQAKRNLDDFKERSQNND